MSSGETNETGMKSRTPSKGKSRFCLASMFGRKKDETSGGEDREGNSVVYSMPSSTPKGEQETQGHTAEKARARSFKDPFCP